MPEKEIKMRKLPNTIFGLIICFYFISTLFLSSCVPEQVTEVVEKPAVTAPLPTSTKEDIEELTPLPTLVENIPTEVVTNPAITEVLTEEVPTETPEPTATVQVESNIPKNVPTEKNENFDFNATDLLNWNEYQLVEVETLDVSETVETAYEGENHLYLMPLDNPEIGRDELTVTVKLVLPVGYTFNIKEKRLVKNSKGEMLTLGIVEDSFDCGASISKFTLLLNAVDGHNEIQGFVEEKAKNYNVITGITSYERDDVNMVRGELLSFQRLLEYQEQIGGFRPGEEISLFEIFQPTEGAFHTGIGTVNGGRTAYLLGSQFLASSLNRLSQKDDSSIERVEYRKIVVGCFPGPFTMETERWDIGVGVTKSSDFTFKIKSDNPDARYFFKIEPIFSNINMAKSMAWAFRFDPPFSKEHSRIIHGATISLVKELPDGQIEMIDTLIESYNQYIDSNATVPMVIPQGITMEKYYLEEGNLKKLYGTGKPFPYIPTSQINRFFD